MSESTEFPVCPPPLPPGPQSALAAPRSKGRWFAISAIAVAAVGIIPALVYLFNALQCNACRFGISGFVLLMCVFGLLFHLIGLALAIIGVVLGAKAGGLIGIICNGGLLLLIVGGALLATCLIAAR